MAFSARTFDYSSNRTIPCVVMDGPPNEKTYGGIGVLYMDKKSGSLYKCVAEDFRNNLFVWEIVGAVSDDAIRLSVSEFLTQNPINSGLSDTEKSILLTLFRGAVYQDELVSETAEAYRLLQNLWGGEAEPDEPVVPDEPEVTLSSISAVYSGGDVAVGTAPADLTGIVVTAHYSDGTSETVTGYTLSGTIGEGSNTITVSYGGMAATFTVTGVAESTETVVAMSSWGTCGDYQFNGGAIYADDGTGGETITFGSGSSNGTLSNTVFEKDTPVNIVLTWDGAFYDSFCVGSSNSETVNKKIVIYHAIKAGENQQIIDGSREINYTVKAGHRLAIVSTLAFTGNLSVTATEV